MSASITSPESVPGWSCVPGPGLDSAARHRAPGSRLHRSVRDGATAGDPSRASAGGSDGASGELRDLQDSWAPSSRWSWSRRRAASRARLHDMSRSEGRATTQTFPLPAPTDPAFRMERCTGCRTRSRAGRAGTPGRGRDPLPLRLRRPGLPDRQRWRAGGPAHAGRRDRALAGVVAGRRNASPTPGSRTDAAAVVAADARDRRDARTPPARGARSTSRPRSRPTAGRSRIARSDETGTDIFTANVGGTLLRATLDRGTLR